MSDARSLSEITGAHPVPWEPRTAPAKVGGQTLIKLFDKTGQEVPLFTILRVVQLVTEKLASQAR